MESSIIVSCLRLLGIILFHLAYAASVRLKNVTVPHYGVKDGSVQLFCDFVLESDTLLVLKWYKDEQEFFRFNPSTLPNILTFNTSGVYVDDLRSNLHIVTLKNISLNSGGIYKCEVSVDKSFRTLADHGQLYVIAPPLYEPEIFGVHPTVSLGSNLVGNCTSYRSKPAASLMFYINNGKIDPQNTIEYSPINEKDGLETSVLGFNITVESKYFIRNKMELKCTATIGNSYWVRIQSVTEAKVNAQPSFSGHNRFLSGSSLSLHQQQQLSNSFSMITILFCQMLAFNNNNESIIQTMSALLSSSRQLLLLLLLLFFSNSNYNY